METNTQVSGWESKEKSEIVAIPNKYKNILDDFIDNSDIMFPDCQRPIDKESYNVSRSENSLIGLLERDCLDQDLLHLLLGLALKTPNFQVYQCYDVIILDPKSVGRVQYKKG